jgi:hypothetical protein
MFRSFVLVTVVAAGIGAALIGTAVPAAAGHWGHGYGYGGYRHYGPPPRHHGWGGPGWRHGHNRHWGRPVPPWHRPMHPYGHPRW